MKKIYRVLVLLIICSIFFSVKVNASENNSNILSINSSVQSFTIKNEKIFSSNNLVLAKTANASSEEYSCPLGPDVTKDLYGILTIIKIIAPLLCIALSIFDAIKAVANGNPDNELKQVAKKFGKRIIYAVLLFFIPVLVDVLFQLTNFWGSHGSCDLKNPVSNGVSSGSQIPSVTHPVCSNIKDSSTCDHAQECEWDRSNNVCKDFGYKK